MAEVEGSRDGGSPLLGKISYLETTSSPETQHSETELHIVVPSHSDISRSSAFIARSRPRLTNNRTRPYHDTSSRPNSHRKATTLCRYFAAGNCTAGDTCRYQHTTPGQDLELDQQLRAFIDEDLDNSQKAPGAVPHDNKSSSTPTPPNLSVKNGCPDFDDYEEFYEVIPHPDAAVSEVRFHSSNNPGQLRSYFLVQRQTVVEYEGNNVGVLSGGVLLGVPPVCGGSAAGRVGDGSLDDAGESEIASSSSPSSVSNSSDIELWQGPVKFDDHAAAESLIWADEEFVDSHMEGIESSTCNDPTSVQEMPTPPPVIRRILRQAEGHNRRHSLS